MKELTIEQKAKRYDGNYKVYTELINRLEGVKDAIKKQNYGIAMDILCKPYPEFQITISIELKEGKESEDDVIIKDMIETIKKEAKDFPSSVIAEKSKSWIAWLEKQGEQKPTGKAKPKFKVGDWIITNKNHIWYVDETPETTSYFYRLINQYGKVEVAEFEVVDKKARLWTIQNAKDGDVLTCYSDIKGQPIEQTGIIKQYVGRHGGCSNSFKAHFGVDWDNNVVIEGYMGSSNIYPATKEQRDLLFKKMKESGYEWDADKKELKKVENEIEIHFGAKDSELQEATYYIPKGFHAEIEGNNVVIKKGEQKHTWTEEDERNLYYWLDNNKSIGNDKYRWLLSLKDRVQPKQEWSDEDKYNHNIILSLLNNECVGSADKRIAIGWLKSLKERYTWKPSDLPHLEKSTLPNDNTTGFNSDYFCHKGYVINYKELFEKLPKDD